MEEIPPFFVVYTRVALCRFFKHGFSRIGGDLTREIFLIFLGQRIISVGRTGRTGRTCQTNFLYDADR